MRTRSVIFGGMFLHNHRACSKEVHALLANTRCCMYFCVCFAFVFASSGINLDGSIPQEEHELVLPPLAE